MVNDPDSPQELLMPIGIGMMLGKKQVLLTAREIAISLSVTVSIGLLKNGVLSTTLRVTRVSVITSAGEKSILPGRIRKSL
jgi:hypothetical protein